MKVETPTAHAEKNVLQLHGYRYSVYTRIAHWALAEKELSFDYFETDPFKSLPANKPASVHPFGKVPVLEHGDFRLYETVAITRYIDEIQGHHSLQPFEPRRIAKMVQIQSMIDQYGYVPMVRQLFAHRVFRPFEGDVADEQQVAAGIAGARQFLAALTSVKGPTDYLCGDSVSLADIHLAPMVDYMQLATEGLDLLDEFPGLTHWWQTMQTRPAFLQTRQFAHRL